MDGSKHCEYAVEKEDDEERPMLFRFQGEFENIELFDGYFDEATLRMHFNGFFLQGAVEDANFTVVEKAATKGGLSLKSLQVQDKMVVFREGPRYVRNDKENMPNNVSCDGYCRQI